MWGWALGSPGGTWAVKSPHPTVPHRDAQSLCDHIAPWLWTPNAPWSHSPLHLIPPHCPIDPPLLPVPLIAPRSPISHLSIPPLIAPCPPSTTIVPQTPSSPMTPLPCAPPIPPLSHVPILPPDFLGTSHGLMAFQHHHRSLAVLPPPNPPCPPFPQCPSSPPWGQAPLTLRTSPGWQSAPVPGTQLVAVPRPHPASASVLLNRGLPCPVAPLLEKSCRHTRVGQP